MPYLLAGLLIFLGVHSLRIVSEDSRTHLRARFGEAAYKGVYTLASLIGFALIVWGFGVARENPVQLWNPPEGMRHLAAGLTLVAFVLLTAAYVNLIFVGVSGKLAQWFELGEDPSVWFSFVLSMVLLALIMRKG